MEAATGEPMTEADLEAETEETVVREEMVETEGAEITVVAETEEAEITVPAETEETTVVAVGMPGAEDKYLRSKRENGVRTREFKI